MISPRTSGVRDVKPLAASTGDEGKTTTAEGGGGRANIQRGRGKGEGYTPRIYAQTGHGFSGVRIKGEASCLPLLTYMGLGVYVCARFAR